MISFVLSLSLPAPTGREGERRTISVFLLLPSLLPLRPILVAVLFLLLLLLVVPRALLPLVVAELLLRARHGQLAPVGLCAVDVAQAELDGVDGFGAFGLADGGVRGRLGVRDALCAGEREREGQRGAVRAMGHAAGAGGHCQGGGSRKGAHARGSCRRSSRRRAPSWRPCCSRGRGRRQRPCLAPLRRACRRRRSPCRTSQRGSTAIAGPLQGGGKVGGA